MESEAPPAQARVLFQLMVTALDNGRVLVTVPQALMRKHEILLATLAKAQLEIIGQSRILVARQMPGSTPP